MKFYLINILYTTLIASQSIKIGLLENEISNQLSPYYTYESDDIMIKESIFGRGLYYYENKLLKTDDVISISYENKLVTITLKEDSKIKVKDVVYTFNHYRNYFNDHQNYKYYFFSKIRNLRSFNNTITFELNEIGLFNLVYFTYPILRTISASKFISNNIFSNGLDYYGYGDFVSILQDKSIKLKPLNTSNINGNDITIKIYQNINLFQTDIISKEVDFYKAVYFSKFIYDNQYVLNNYRKRYVNKMNHNLFLIGFNPKIFSKEERKLFAKIIDRERIISSYVYFQGKLANSLYPSGSDFYFSRNSVIYDPISALSGLNKQNYSIQSNGEFKKKSQKNTYRLFYPKDNELYQIIANEIILNFAELKIPIQAIAVDEEELNIRISKNRYEIFLKNINYDENEFISLFQFLINNKLINTNKIIRNIKRLESIDVKRNYIPLIHRIQLQIEEEQDFLPLFFITHDQILINKTIEDYLTRYTFLDQRYFEIKSISKWNKVSE